MKIYHLNNILMSYLRDLIGEHKPIMELNNNNNNNSNNNNNNSKVIIGQNGKFN